MRVSPFKCSSAPGGWPTARYPAPISNHLLKLLHKAPCVLCSLKHMALRPPLLSSSTPVSRFLSTRPPVCSPWYNWHRPQSASAQGQRSSCAHCQLYCPHTLLSPFILEGNSLFCPVKIPHILDLTDCLLVGTFNLFTKYPHFMEMGSLIYNLG